MAAAYLGRLRKQARRRVERMRHAFPLAAVRDYRDLAPAMLHHPRTATSPDSLNKSRPPQVRERARSPALQADPGACDEYVVGHLPNLNRRKVSSVRTRLGRPGTVQAIAPGAG